MENNYSQDYVADVIGVSQKTYSNMENDKTDMSLNTIQKILSLYDIELSTIDVKKLFTEGKIIHQSNTSHDSSTGGVIYNLNNDELIKQKDDHIADLKATIIDLRKSISLLEKAIKDF